MKDAGIRPALDYFTEKFVCRLFTHCTI